MIENYVINRDGFLCMQNKELSDVVEGHFINLSQKIKGERHWVVLTLSGGEDFTRNIFLNRTLFSNLAFIFAMTAKDIVLGVEDELQLTLDHGFVNVSYNGEEIPLDTERDENLFRESGDNLSVLLERLSGHPSDIFLQPSVGNNAIDDDKPQTWESIASCIRDLCESISEFDTKNLYAQDVEEAVIAAILTDSKHIDAILTQLSPDCFLDVFSRNIFESSVKIWKDLRKPTLQAIAKDIGADEEELKKLAMLAGRGPESHIEYFIMILLQYKFRRRVLEESARLFVSAMNKNNGTEELMDMCRRLLVSARQ